MKSKSFLIYLILLVLSIKTYCQEKTHSLTFNISVAEEVRPSFNQNGRLFIYMSKHNNPSRWWPHFITKDYYVYAKNFSDWESNDILTVTNTQDWEKWARFEECNFINIPEGIYYIQLVWDQNFDTFGVNAEGNISSKELKVELNASQNIDLKLSDIIKSEKLIEHKLVKLAYYKSDTLSKWYGKPVYERAAIFLPSKYYENPEKEYPIRYHIGGGFSPYARVNRLISDTTFYNWWLSNEAPQIITVFLDGELNGNLYHIDSDNMGPHGYSLINEFIPYIENSYRGTLAADNRFTDGCSTGGWASLALQLFYPETFNGCFSYSPDPISFNKFFDVNIYEDENMFYDRYGYDRFLSKPDLMTNRNISMRDWVKFENVLGYTGTYLDSDHEFGYMSTIFSPKGVNGQPISLFDHETGQINSKVAESWRRYDLSQYIIDNWEDIGSKLKGKIYIWNGTADEHYLDISTRIFESKIKQLENPESDAIFEYAPYCGHCEKYSHRRVLEQIAEKLEEKNEK